MIKKIFNLFSILLFGLILSLTVNTNIVYGQNDEIIEIYFKINGEEDLTRDILIDGYDETYGDVELEMWARSLTGTNERLFALEFNLNPNDFITGISDIQSVFVTSGRTDVSTWNTAGSNLNENFISMAAENNQDDGSNVLITEEGTQLSWIFLNLDITKLTDNFSIDFTFSDAGYQPPTGNSVQYTNSQIKFSLVVGDPAAEPDSTLKELTISGSESVYENSVDDINLDDNITITYQDSLIGIDIAPITNSATATFEVLLNDEPYSSPTILIDNDVFKIIVTDEDKTTTYTRTISITEASNNVSATLDTNKEVNVIYFDGNNTFTIELPYSITELNVMPNLFDRNASTNKETLSFSNLLVGIPSENTFIVTAEDGTTTKEYEVKVVRKEGNSNTDIIANVNGDNIHFNSEQETYIYTLPLNQDSYTLMAEGFESSTNVTYSEDGNVYSSNIIQNSIIKGGSDTIYLKAISENGTEKIYTITIERTKSNNTSLNSVEITEHPIFSPFELTFNVLRNRYEYTLKDLTSTNLTLTIHDKVEEYQTIEFLDENRQLISQNIDAQLLQNGDNIFYIKVIAQNGSDYSEYQLVIIKQSDEREITNIVIQDRDRSFQEVDQSLYQIAYSGNDIIFTFNYETIKNIRVVITTSQRSTISGQYSGRPSNNNAYYDFSFTLTSKQVFTTNQITVTAENGLSTNYKIDVERLAADNNNNLTDIKINDISLFGFQSNKYDNYETVMINRNSNSFNILGIKESDKSTVEYYINNIKQTSNQLSILPGNKVTVEIRVTAQDLSQVKYFINVSAQSEENELLNIEISNINAGLFVFDRDQHEYNISVASSITAVSISATASDYATIIGTGDYILTENQTVKITVYARSESGIDSGEKYVINIFRNPARNYNNLENLELEYDGNTHVLIPGSSQTTFTHRVDNRVEEVLIRATITGDNGEKILNTVGNTYSRLEQITSGPSGESFTITVQAENGNTKVYTIKIIRANNISTIDSLTIDGTNYNVDQFIDGTLSLPSLAYSKDRLEVSTNLTDELSTVLYSPNLNNGYWIFNNHGELILTITVTAQDGVTKTNYQVKVNRENPKNNNDLYRLEVLVEYDDGIRDLMNDISLEERSDFNLRVDREINKVTINAYLLNTDMSTINGWGTPRIEGSFKVYSREINLLSEGQTTIETISVFAEDPNISKKDYRVSIVRKNANNEVDLINISDGINTVFEGTIDELNEFEYLGTFAHSVKSLTVTVYKLDQYSKVIYKTTEYGLQQNLATFNVDLTSGLDQTFSFRVLTDVLSNESTDFKEEVVYIKYNRNSAQSNNDLYNLSANVGEIDYINTQDPFNIGNDNYEIRVDRGTSSVEIFVYLIDAYYSKIQTTGFNFVESIDGISKYRHVVTFNSSQHGTMKTLEFTVSAENGDTKTFSIDIHNKNAIDDLDSLLADGQEVIFDSETNEYDLGIYLFNTEEIELEITKVDRYSKVYINGVLVNLNNKSFTHSTQLKVGNNQSINIRVETEINDTNNNNLGYSSKTYKLIYTRQAANNNTDLAELEVNANIDGNIVNLLEEDFNKDILYYQLIVERNLTQVEISAVSNYNAKISNLGLKPIPTNQQTIEVVVTAEDGVTTKTYYIEIVKQDSNNKITNIIIAGIEHSFIFDELDGGPFDLGIHPFGINEVTFNVVKESNYSTLSLNGVQTLKEGINEFVIYATNERGEEGLKYTFIIEREVAYTDTTLLDLELIDLNNDQNLITYTPGTYTYNVTITNTLVVDLIVSLKNEHKQRIVGTTGEISVIYQQNGTVNQEIKFSIEVDGLEREYTINLIKGVVLSDNYNFDLEILDIYNNSYLDFDMDTNEYEITIPYSIDRLSLNFIKEHDKASPSFIRNIPTIILVGSTKVEFIMRAENGDESSLYTITITRDAASTVNTLKEILITSNGEKILGLEDSLYTFDENQLIYNISLDESYEQILITRTRNNSGQSTSGPLNQALSLSHGLNKYQIIVTPEDTESLIATYTINITIKNSEIRLLNLSVDNIEFEFNENTYSYNLGQVDGRYSEIIINGSISDPYGLVSGLGNKTLNEGVNTFNIVVKSEDGSKELTYQIIIELIYSDDKEIVLAQLLDENNNNYLEFEIDVFEYNLVVDHEVANLYLNIVLNHQNAKLIGNTNYSLNAGEVTTIIFQVMAENNTLSEEYQINVLRSSQSNDANLLSITIKDNDGNILLGLLEENPSIEVFNQNKTAYTINLNRSYEQVSITPVLSDAKASLNGDVGLLDLLPGRNINIFRYRVTSEDGKVSKTYTININVLNQDIDLLSLSVVGYNLDQPFDPNINTYDIGIINENINLLNVVATLSDEFGSLTGVGNQIIFTGRNALIVTATSEDGKVSKTYTIYYEKEESTGGGGAPISSDAILYDLDIIGLKSPIDFSFDPLITNYDIELSFEDGQFYLDAYAHARSTIHGMGLKSINPGESKTFVIQVIAEDGTEGEKYYLNVVRKNASDDNDLLSLWVEINGEVTYLDIDKRSFTINVTPDINTLLIDAITPVGAISHGLGLQTLIDTSSIFTITVVAENGSLQTYNIQIIKVDNNAKLSSLLVTDVLSGNIIAFTYTFNPNTYEYLITLSDTNIQEIEISATSQSQLTTISGTGIKNLKPGTGGTTDRFSIITTAQDGISKETYVITIERNIDPDDSITIDNLFLSGDGVIYLGNDRHPNARYQFISSTHNYEIIVPYTLKDVTLTITNPDGATIIGVGNYRLDTMETTIVFQITSKSGVVSSGEYTVKVIKEEPSNNNLLNEIRIDNILIDGFDPLINEYELTVDSNKVNEITLNALLGDMRANLSGNLGRQNINPGKNTFSILVVAEDGSENIYIIIVNSLSFANDITNIEVLDYDLTPNFNANITTYEVNVSYDTTNIEIVSQASDKATIIGAGIKTNLAVGSSIFTVYAVSESGAEGIKYYITVNRAAPSDDTSLKQLAFYDQKDGTLIPFESSFDPSVREYIVNLAEGINIMSAYIVAEASSDKAIVFNSGYQLLGGFVDGDYHTILTISVRAESGLIENYRISVYRNVDLSDIIDIDLLSLIGDDGNIYFDINEFSNSILNYEINVPYQVKSLNLVINSIGTVYGSGQRQFNSSNSINFEFYIISQNTTNQSPKYTITVNREEALSHNELTSLTINGVMVPNFDPQLNSYEITIPSHNSNSIVVDATSYEDSLIQGLGNKTLQNGTNTFTISVIAQNGDINTYTIVINYVDSNALLETLVVRGSNEDVYNDDSSKLYTNYQFEAENFEYIIIVDTNTKFVRITGSAQDQAGARVTGFGTYQIGNSEERIRIYVESASGLVTETYIVRITKVSIPSNNARLNNLTIGGEDIGFISNNFIYRVNVASDVDYITLSAEAINPNASIYIEGYNHNPNNTITYSIEDIETGKNVILIKVVAEDGSSSEYYQVVITRDQSPDFMLMVLLILSLFLWIITVLIMLIRNSRMKVHNKDDVIF